MQTKLSKPYDFESHMAQLNYEIALDKEFPIHAFFNNLYPNIRRFILNTPNLPRDGYRKVQRGVQRAYRGWSDEDVWSLFHYHAKITYEMLIHLKKMKNGFPTEMLPEEAQFGGNITDEMDKVAIAKWENILDRMIYAYKLNIDIAEGERCSYSPHFTPEDINEFKSLSQREECDRKIGMFLFDRYYFNLWD